MGGEESLSFSVELKSREHVTRVSLSADGREEVLGELEEVGMLEDAILCINGSNGTLRGDLTEEELRKILAKKKKI